uniref:Uncharacterized protein n=1 Tax=Sphaerodactylus townsendi TaxID=933632 RepID=A0ACB8EFA1_9SAUR
MQVEKDDVEGDCGKVKEDDGEGTTIAAFSSCDQCGCPLGVISVFGFWEEAFSPFFGEGSIQCLHDADVSQEVVLSFPGDKGASPSNAQRWIWDVVKQENGGNASLVDERFNEGRRKLMAREAPGARKGLCVNCQSKIATENGTKSCAGEGCGATWNMEATKGIQPQQEIRNRIIHC